MPPESRAEYFKDRRAKFKSFTVEVEREKMEAFERKLQERQESKRNGSTKRLMKNSANKNPPRCSSLATGRHGGCTPNTQGLFYLWRLAKSIIAVLRVKIKEETA